MALVLRVWQNYERLLQTKPVVTQMVTSASLWCVGGSPNPCKICICSHVEYLLSRALGDVLSQKIDGGKCLDLRRTAYTACFGGILLGTAFI